MGVVTRSELATQSLAEEVAALRVILRERHQTIREQGKALQEQADVVRQLLAKSRDDAIAIATLRTQIARDGALRAAVAQRDAREYAQSMARSPMGNANAR